MSFIAPLVCAMWIPETNLRSYKRDRAMDAIDSGFMGRYFSNLMDLSQEVRLNTDFEPRTPKPTLYSKMAPKPRYFVAAHTLVNMLQQKRNGYEKQRYTSPSISDSSKWWFQGDFESY